jgi:hypothetical protein
MAAAAWLIGEVLLAGTAAAASFTISSPIELDRVDVWGGDRFGVDPWNRVTRVTISPDATTTGDLVCLNPSSSCAGAEILVLRVSVAPESTEYLQFIAVSTTLRQPYQWPPPVPGPPPVGMGYFAGDGIAPDRGEIYSNPAAAVFLAPDSSYLQPGETSPTLFVTFAQDDLMAGQEIIIYGAASTFAFEARTIVTPIDSKVPAVIDIKPRSDRNRINTLSRGSIRVAILGSSSFDVEDVDVATLGFGPNGIEPKHDLTVTRAFLHHMRDVDRDGYTDLMMHYRIRDVGFSIEDTEACLSGRLVDGTGFEGCDSVWMFGRWGQRLLDRWAPREIRTK